VICAVSASSQASKATSSDASLRSNPFSKSFDPTAKHAVQKGMDGYGRPPPGSKTEERAMKAQEWVDTEIDKLLGVIKSVS
jgi:hypothetical protein